MAAVPGTAPIVPVSDLGESIGFYTGCLGFSLEIGSAEYAYALLRRDDAMIALFKTDDAEALIATGRNIAVQIWVRDLGAVWQQVAAQIETLPPERWKPPHDRAYGAREFHIKDPDGFLMFFTQLPAGA